MNNTRQPNNETPTWVRPIDVAAIRQEIAAGKRFCEYNAMTTLFPVHVR